MRVFFYTATTWVIDLISFLFILLFTYAAFSKLYDFEKFSVQLSKSPLLAPFAWWISWTIPLFEIIIAISLVSNRLKLFGMYASFTLMVMFSAYIVAILNFSEYIPCSCGGILENMNWKQHLLFNILFVILGAVGVLLYPTIEKNLLANNRRKPKNLNSNE